MSDFPLDAVKAALFHAMVNDAALMALVDAVHDKVPTGALFPYVVIESSAVEPWGILHANAHRCRFELDIYSRKGGQKELLQAASLLRDILHHVPLVVAGWDVALVDVAEIDTDRQQDGLTVKANMVVNVWVKESGA